MNNKERLESIKKKFSAQRSVNARTYESLDLYNLSYEEGDWLIEQAEKVEQLQQEIAALKEVIQAVYDAKRFTQGFNDMVGFDFFED